MRILIVEDDVVSRITLADMIQEVAPANITEAETADQAWSLLSGPMYPVIVFCDLHMPGGGGVDLIARIREEPLLTGIQIAVVTANADLSTMRRLRDLSIASALVKPLESEAVHARLNKLVSMVKTQGVETTEDVQVRMRIDAERYAAYLDTLLRQMQATLLSAQQMLAFPPEDMNKRALIQKLDSLQSGCHTLGLHAVSRAIQKIERVIREQGIHQAVMEALLDADALMRSLSV